MFVKTNIIKKTIRKIGLKLFNIVENNENHNLYENGEENFLNLLFKYYNNKQMVVFDIGANVGEYTQLVDKKSKENNIDMQIHSFEPTKYCFDILKEKFQNKDNIFLNNFGLSDSECEATIYSDSKGSGLTSLYQRNLDHYGISFNETETIKLKTLEAYIKRNNIEHINFLKIDIEGHELKAFQGLKKYLNGDFIDFIQFEYGGTSLDAKISLLDMYMLFKKNGFLIGKIMKNGVEIREYEAFMDNFLYANYIVVSNKIYSKGINL
jgi:FkbM family methyltransferase